MHPNPSRVAYHHLTAAPIDGLLSTVQDALKAVQSRVADLASQAELMDRLIEKGKARGRSRHDRGKENRVDRARRIGQTLSGFRSDGSKVEAKVPSDRGGSPYNTSITLKPSPSYKCSCVDHADNGRIGPCKHVMGLAFHYRDENLTQELDSLATTLTSSAF